MTDPYAQPAPQAYAPPPYNPNAKTNGLAIASLIVSFLGFSIVGVVLGHIAISQIKSRGEGGSPLAIIGLILGYLGCLAWLVFWGVIIVGVIYAGSVTNYLTTYDYYNY